MNAWLCPFPRGCCTSKMHFWDVRICKNVFVPIYFDIFNCTWLKICLNCPGKFYEKMSWSLKNKDTIVLFDFSEQCQACNIIILLIRSGAQMSNVVYRPPVFYLHIKQNNIGKLWPHLIELFSEDEFMKHVLHCSLSNVLFYWLFC